MKFTKTTLAGSCLVLGTMLSPVAYAADGDKDRADPKTFVKDSVITTKIKAKLASEHISSATNISVDTDQNGIVWMSGTAKSQEEINQAVAIAKNTEGVKTVKADLKVQKNK